MTGPRHQGAEEQAGERGPAEQAEPQRRHLELRRAEAEGGADDAESEAIAEHAAGARGGDAQVEEAERRVLVGEWWPVCRRRPRRGGGSLRAVQVKSIAACPLGD